MGILDKLLGRPTDADLIERATTYAIKRGVADGALAMAEWAQALAFGDGDLTPAKGREFAAELVAAIENDEPLPAAIPRPFVGPGAATHEEIARATFAEIGQRFDAYSASDQLGMTGGLARNYEAGFEVSIHTVLKSVADGTVESKIMQAVEPPPTPPSDSQSVSRPKVDETERLQREAHAACGGRITELQALLRAGGLNAPADMLEEADWTKAFKAQGGCMERLEQGPHGVVWCVEAKGHDGDHAGRCIPCELTLQTIDEMEQRSGRRVSLT